MTELRVIYGVLILLFVATTLLVTGCSAMGNLTTNSKSNCRAECECSPCENKEFYIKEGEK